MITKNRKLKFLFITATIFLMIFSVSGLEYDFSTNAINAEAENTELKLTELQNFESYTIARKTTGGATADIISETSSGTGTVLFEFDADPVQNDVAFNEKGFNYVVLRDGQQVADVYLVYGTGFRYLDTFTDGTVNTAMYENVAPSDISFSESNGHFDAQADGSIDADGTHIRFNQNLTKDDVILIDYEELTGKGGGIVQSCLNVPGACLNFEVTTGSERGTYTVRYDEENTQWVMENMDGDYSVTSSAGNIGTFKPSIKGEDDTHHRIYEYNVVDENNAEYWADVNKFKPDSGIFRTKAVFSDTDGTPNVQFKNQDSSYTSVIDELGFSESLTYRTIGNGSANFVFTETRPTDFFGNLTPKSDTLVGPDRMSVEFDFDIPTEYNLGYFEVQVENETGGYERRPFNVEVVNPTVTCSGFEQIGDRERIQFENSEAECHGKRLSFNVDVRDAQRSFKWRVNYDNTGQLIKEKGGNFNSETRSAVRDIPETEINSVFPPQGVTLTEFQTNLKTYADIGEAGDLKVKVNDTVVDSFRFNRPPENPVTLDSQTTLTNSAYQWNAEFVGDSGTVYESKTRTFNVDTSLDTAVNFSLNNPVNDESVKAPDVNFNSFVQSTEPGNVSLYVNGEKVITQDLEQGNNTLDTSYIADTAGLTSWYLTVEQDTGNLFVSDSETFDLVENVEVLSLKPEDGSTVDRPPIVFEADVETSTAGSLSLIVDDETRETKTIGSDFNGTKQFKVDSSIEKGKHSFSFRFESDSSGQTYSSETKTFDLEVGATDTGELKNVGGSIGRTVHGAVGATLGLSIAQTVYLMVFGLISLFSAAVSIKSNSGLIGGILFIGLIITASVTPLLPFEVFIVASIIAGGMLVKGAT